jgi:hypothetical protein
MLAIELSSWVWNTMNNARYEFDDVLHLLQQQEPRG